jgi:integrase
MSQSSNNVLSASAGSPPHGVVMPEWSRPGRPSDLVTRPDGVCANPKCGKPVPGGEVSCRTRHYFCNKLCLSRFYNSQQAIGECLSCGAPILAFSPKGRNAKFCSEEHYRAHEAECTLAPMGAFRETVEEYLSLDTTRAESTMAGVRLSLSKFFTYIVEVENVHVLDDITSKMVTRFLVAERDRGMTSCNSIGHVSTFFNWMMSHDLFDNRNPVIPRIHTFNNNHPNPRPYADGDLASVWADVESIGNRALMLAFAIGQECGLRIGEVENIRLSDVDTYTQNITVRLPNKGKRVRNVPYSHKVKKYLTLWLEVRNSNCEHDHVLHGAHSTRFRLNTLACLFKKRLREKEGPSGSFTFHRLRHTWATRLLNNGMDLTVLMKLGGWVNLNSLQRYIKILPETVRIQYEAAYNKIESPTKRPPSQTFSLLEYVAMEPQDEESTFPKAA